MKMLLRLICQFISDNCNKDEVNVTFNIVYMIWIRSDSVSSKWDTGTRCVSKKDKFPLSLKRFYLIGCVDRHEVI